MSSGPSDSDATSPAFERFHPGVQRWLWNQGWTSLRSIQEQTAIAILDTDGDLIVAAPTASGKTEAAWLPICSQLARADGIGQDDTTQRFASGIQALYIAPLKALINDQHTRLGDLCQVLELPVHRWHGDVPGSQKTNLLRDASGLLLITPESVEALFVNRGTEIASLLSGLTHIVVDELHSFLGTERGAQLQSLLHRIELALRRRIPRVALSATLGDFSVAREFLRPGGADGVQVIEDVDGDAGELKLQLRGYIDTPPDADVAALYDQDEEADDDDAAEGSIADHLYRILRGHDNLAFANSRRQVEQLTDRLTRRSETNRVPNEFVAHHGNLSREMREDAEMRLKDPTRPTTAICTSTLEMGIDIGSVDTIAQIGAPGTVSGLRQRLGRSGRRAGQAAVLRAYVTEHALDSRTSLADQLRSELVQTIAMVDLLLEGWYESPNSKALHLSTLMQQVLSMIAQHGGVLPAQVYSALCREGPFRRVDSPMFAHLLRAMGAADLVVQEPSGLLLHGTLGERLVNHYSFYAAFASAEEYRLIADGRPIGSLPVEKLLVEGSLLIFGGRRWRVLTVDTTRKVITLTRARGGKAPRFTGDGPTVADRVRRQMRHVLTRTEVPTYLDATAQTLVAEARATFRDLDLHTHSILGTETETIVLPWRGDDIMATLALAFTRYGLPATADGLVLTVVASPEVTRAAAAEIAAQQAPDPRELATLVKYKERDKHDRYLDEDLLTASFAASLDVPGAWATLREIANDAGPVVLDEPLVDLIDVAEGDTATIAELEECDFAVIDVETTGLAINRGDRIIEIAIVQVDRHRRVGRSWSTLINPDRDPGPTHIHRLTRADLVDAPHFADVVGDIASLIAGRIVVAHNALFDLACLHAEFARAGRPLPPWPTLCTLDAAYVLRPDGPRKLTACASEEGIEILGAHTALGDATMTALLLGHYLTDARAAGLQLDALGTRPLVMPPVWTAGPPSGRVHERTEASSENTDTGLALRVDVARRGTPADDAYLDALDRALADLRLSDTEAADLRELAAAYGLDRHRVQQLNSAYVGALAAVRSDVDGMQLLRRLAAA